MTEAELRAELALLDERAKSIKYSIKEINRVRDSVSEWLRYEARKSAEDANEKRIVSLFEESAKRLEGIENFPARQSRSLSKDIFGEHIECDWCRNRFEVEAIFFLEKWGREMGSWVVVLYYGFDGRGQKTLKEVASLILSTIHGARYISSGRAGDILKVAKRLLRSWNKQLRRWIDCKHLKTNKRNQND